VSLTKTNNLFNNLLLHQCHPLYMLLLVYRFIYLRVLITNHQMEDDMEIHLKEVHLEEIHWKSHPFNPPIGSFGWLAPNPRMFIPPWYQPLVVQPISKPTTKLPYKKLQYPTYVKDTNPYVHIKYSRRPLKLIVKQWRLTSSTCVVLLLGIIYLKFPKFH